MHSPARARAQLLAATALDGAVARVAAPSVRPVKARHGAVVVEDQLEPAWQDSFFGGANYARLQAIKASVDPEGRFGCWHCVELPGGAGAEEAAASVMRSAS